MSDTAVWDKSVDALKSHLDPQIFAAWIKPLRLAEFQVTDGNNGSSPLGEVTLVAPNKFCRDHVQHHYQSIIGSTLSEVLGTSRTTIRFQIGSSSLPQRAQFTPSVEKLKRANGTQKKARSFETANLNPNYNFSNFVVGPCNQFPHAVSLRVCESPGTAYNPLFLYGETGLGKTHLVNAIGSSSMRRGKRVLLVSSEVFVNELISSLRFNRMDQFKSKFRSLDLLIIDDIQFLMGKERTQEEFFHTFNDLHQRNKQIVVTSDKVPQQLTGLEERLRTRFASGLIADMQPPDFETRVAILAKKAEASDILLPNDVARLLAEKIDTNVRELEGALNRLQAISSLQQSEITLALAEKTLGSVLPGERREVTKERIQETVARHFNVSPSDLLGKRRTQNIAFARHVAMYLCRELTSASYPEIGAVFGGRDHSTVIHAYRAIQEKMGSNQVLEKDIGELRRFLTH